jgi:hypothetical protein
LVGSRRAGRAISFRREAYRINDTHRRRRKILNTSRSKNSDPTFRRLVDTKYLAKSEIPIISQATDGVDQLRQRGGCGLLARRHGDRCGSIVPWILCLLASAPQTLYSLAVTVGGERNATCSKPKWTGKRGHVAPKLMISGGWYRLRI